MANDNQVAMPQEQAGLIRYFDADAESTLRLDPKLVVAGITVLIMLEIVFQQVIGPSLGV